MERLASSADAEPKWVQMEATKPKPRYKYDPKRLKRLGLDHPSHRDDEYVRQIRMPMQAYAHDLNHGPPSHRNDDIKQDSPDFTNMTRKQEQAFWRNRHITQPSASIWCKNSWMHGGVCRVMGCQGECDFPAQEVPPDQKENTPPTATGPTGTKKKDGQSVTSNRPAGTERLRDATAVREEGMTLLRRHGYPGVEISDALMIEWAKEDLGDPIESASESEGYDSGKTGAVDFVGPTTSGIEADFKPRSPKALPRYLTLSAKIFPRPGEAELRERNSRTISGGPMIVKDVARLSPDPSDGAARLAFPHSLAKHTPQ